jgi:hypothetical protein
MGLLLIHSRRLLTFCASGEGAEPRSLIPIQGALPVAKKAQERKFPVTSYFRLASILKRMFEFGWAIWRGVRNVAEFAIAK